MCENPVLFGIIDARVQARQEALDNVCFGGVKWLQPAPSIEQVSCPHCMSIMSLVLQGLQPTLFSFKTLYIVEDFLQNQSVLVGAEFLLDFEANGRM